MQGTGITGAAIIDGPYRYSLTRAWEPGLERVCFVMLNPSVADAALDDPTLRRCLGFARGWGFGSLEVVNLFALRATDPAALRLSPDPVGPENDAFIAAAVLRAGLVVAAWGALGGLRDRARSVWPLLGSPCCLGLTRTGHPRHPLYVRSDTAPRPLGAAP